MHKYKNIPNILVGFYCNFNYITLLFVIEYIFLFLFFMLFPTSVLIKEVNATLASMFEFLTDAQLISNFFTKSYFPL
ncbi:MAG: hypothetical protein C6W54_02355 [Bacillaceae bacterium]|nr:MAG: hypothetical protein C6W54_02355 [Bacillaceae bacterium]